MPDKAKTTETSEIELLIRLAHLLECQQETNRATLELVNQIVNQKRDFKNEDVKLTMVK